MRPNRSGRSGKVKGDSKMMDPGRPAPDRRQTLRLSPHEVVQAAALLRQGGLVAFPTETVYGLGADATRADAVAGVYAAKGRPRFNPLIAHVADRDAARREGAFDATAHALSEAFWPGPLTLVVAASPCCSVSDLARAGLDSVALRVPAHPLAQALLRAVGHPVAAPSANRSGRVSPTQVAHVLADLDGRIDALLDGGPTAVGLESTIVACLGGRAQLLRPGGVPREAIEGVLGKVLAEPEPDSAAPRAPGMLASHYAPLTPVRINARRIAPGEAALLFGSEKPDGLEDARAVLNLSAGGDLVEAAACLFAHLRELDRCRASAIAAASVPQTGLGEAINDRLRRAAVRR
ncbi:MAG: Threonylcarbamoyl-AMP synthase / SUA5 domain with internal deletion [uncultured Microvirga sp.]|uniref:Threonylcarbamoyl-AMP synthase n=1 Tax=uncultured Microvirga sp. TaxID=412392 RepID=A0A6J4LWA2_9HYPH|nr:MAG: Threonylcarbamoyl-AMP synthase / SUA5 domain with internal deletion [uncultured Microvirga sp.]